MKLTKELYYDKINFCPYIRLLNDGVEFARFSIELLQDLTFISEPDSPFKGPELSAKDAFEEIFLMAKHELNDSSLDEELRELLHAKFNTNKI
jgi:hypothetical protein